MPAESSTVTDSIAEDHSKPLQSRYLTLTDCKPGVSGAEEKRPTRVIEPGSVYKHKLKVMAAVKRESPTLVISPSGNQLSEIPRLVPVSLHTYVALM